MKIMYIFAAYCIKKIFFMYPILHISYKIAFLKPVSFLNLSLPVMASLWQICNTKTWIQLSASETCTDPGTNNPFILNTDKITRLLFFLVIIYVANDSLYLAFRTLLSEYARSLPQQVVPYPG